jgi:FkbM family methyltransferase
MINIFEFIDLNIRKNNSVIFEIGCHIGQDTEKIYNSSNCLIHGFEPDPRNFEILINKKSEFFCSLNSFAISNIDGHSNFFISSGNPPEIYDNPDLNRDWSASNSLKKPVEHLNSHPWCKFENNIVVKTKRIDTYSKEKSIKNIDFIWMDVQGAEDLVISGLGEMKNKIKYIYTEYSDLELYEGSSNKEKILKMLGENWEILIEYENDILIENKLYQNENI